MSLARSNPGPVIGLPAHSVRAVRAVAFAWALIAIGGLILATELDLFRYRPGGDAYVILEQQAFGIGFIASVLLALRWPVIGGALAGMTAAALLVFARHQLQPVDAAVVVVAFAVPGVLWVLLDVHDLRPRPAAIAVALIAVAVGGGAIAAQSVYDDLFGPSHPSSSLPALPGSDVEWILSGSITDSSAVVTAKLEGSVTRLRLAVSPTPAFDRPRWVEASSFDADKVARFEIAALQADTEYHYAVEADGVLDTIRAGSFSTFPNGPASFTIAVGACSRVGTNGAVFDAIRSLDPTLFVVTGDFHYANIGEDDPGKFRDVLDHQFTRTAPSALLRSAPLAYVWDDHDYGANNADGTSDSRPAAMEVYRQYVPHYALAGADSAIYQAFTIGRVRVIMTDTRSARSPASDPDNASKTMLGAPQKAWLKEELRAARDAYPLIIWVNSLPWIAAAAPGGDDWGGYATERAEIAEFIADEGIDGLVMVSGDAHMVAIDDGSNSDYSTSGGGGFPVLHAAALDRPGKVKGGPYSHGAFPGGGQFGLVSVLDDGGDAITVELSGRDWEDTVLVSYEFTVPAGSS